MGRLSSVATPVLAASRRLRAASRRTRVMVGLTALVAIAAGWYGYRRWTDWPPYAILRSPEHTWPLTFSPDGALLATAGENNITFWDARTGKKRASLSVPDGRTAYLGVFTPDGRTFADLSYRRNEPALIVDIYEVGTGRVRGSVPTKHGGMLGLAVLDNGRAIRAVVYQTGAPEVVDCDVATGDKISSRDLSCPIPRYPVGLSDDGRIMALAPAATPAQKNLPASEAILWDLDLDREVTRLRPPEKAAEIVDLTFSGDGKTLALARDDGSIELWDLPAATLRARFAGHGSSFVPIQLHLSPDGSQIASMARFALNRRPFSIRSIQFWAGSLLPGDHDPPVEVVLFDTTSGRPLRKLESEGRPRFSPDGNTLATGSIDGTARLRTLPRSR